MPNERFLLGYGERLTGPVTPASGGAPSNPPYDFDEAIRRLTPEVTHTTRALQSLPTDACPSNEAVAVVMLHPQALAKSYHPKKLLDQFVFHQVGSRPVPITPEKWTRKGEPGRSPSTELYVAGDRASFDDWAHAFAYSPDTINEAIQRIEAVYPPEIEQRLRRLDRAESTTDGILVELLIHARQTDKYIMDGFQNYAASLGVDAQFKRSLFVGGLCYVPAEATHEQLEQLALFSFLRTVRPLSHFRNSPTTIERAIPMPEKPTAPLPTTNAIDPDIQVAVFDGGIPAGAPLNAWVDQIELPGVDRPVPKLEQQGYDVSSAILFGSLNPGQPAPAPFARIDHYRIVDTQSLDDPFELYDALRHIESVLKSKKYQFVNLSIGPATPIEDDDIHPWTALLDSLLSDGETLVTIAAGNNGHLDDAAERRIQVPSDCINALTVGAADSTSEDWVRAPYSAVGPGRAPGRIKPDLVGFGGSEIQPFFVSSCDGSGSVAATMGTSFAAPSVLRTGIGMRAYFGEQLRPLGIKALLIHAAAQNNSNILQKEEVGRGKAPTDLKEITTCKDGEVSIIYQGNLEPSKYLRAKIPLPPELPNAYITITATFTFACETDPEDPGNYSRSGLNITFRPHAEKFEGNSTNPKSQQFYKKSDYDTEQTLRNDAQVWETTLHNSKRMRSTSLHNPVFDIHHNARTNGAAPKSPKPIPYALVITIASSKIADLYERVLQKHVGYLEALQPVIKIPLQP